MIIFTTERCDGVCVARLEGRFEVSDEPRLLAEHLLTVAASLPLVLDLSDLDEVDTPEVVAMLGALGATPRHATSAIVHSDVDARRKLRALEHPIPVAPTMGHVLQGPFATALEAARARSDA